MGEGPTLTTARLRAIPLTLWNASFVAEELARSLVPTGVSWAGATLGGLFGGAVDSGSIDPVTSPSGAPIGADPASVRRELRRRANAGSGTLTWVIRARDGAACGLLAADTHRRRATVGVAIAAGFRRDGLATEIIRALASWLEYRGVVVATRIRVGDTVGKRLAQATAFVPTGIVLAERRRLWVRPPVG